LEAGGFRTTEESLDDETQLVAVSGDVDLKTARQFRDAIQDAAEDGKPRLIVDLSDVPFMDSSGLAALIGAHKTLRSRVKVVVVCPPNLQRIFEVTRLNTVVPVVGTLAEALVA
jgi:anti-anti-sigma factor